jgi:hypothetical protein
MDEMSKIRLKSKEKLLFKKNITKAPKKQDSKKQKTTQQKY